MRQAIFCSSPSFHYSIRCIRFNYQHIKQTYKLIATCDEFLTNRRYVYGEPLPPHLPLPLPPPTHLLLLLPARPMMLRLPLLASDPPPASATLACHVSQYLTCTDTYLLISVLFIISVSLYISPYPQEDPYPFLFGSPARYVLI